MNRSQKYVDAETWSCSIVTDVLVRQEPDEEEEDEPDEKDHDNEEGDEEEDDDEGYSV